MKGLIIGAMLLVLVGCGKTISQVKSTSNETIDNGVGIVNNAVYTGGAILKTFVGVLNGAYNVGKSAAQDTQDNALTVVNSTVGVGQQK